MEKLVALHIKAEDYDPVKSWQLASWCQKQGAEDWTLKIITVKGAKAALAESFEEVATPFCLPKAKRRQLTAYGSGSGPDAFIVPTELWRLNSASLALLQDFLSDGLFTYRADQDCWFEDLVFYRKGEFMLGVVSHENEGILRVTQTERIMLEANGFIFSPRGSYVGY